MKKIINDNYLVLEKCKLNGSTVFICKEIQTGDISFINLYEIKSFKKVKE